jgi:hypothetical protein
MTLVGFFAGIGCATFGLAGLYFLKFWKVSRDRFFALLCAACWLLAVERIAGVLSLVLLPTDELTQGYVRPWIYLFRLFAFAAILVAIVVKNRSVDRR